MINGETWGIKFTIDSARKISSAVYWLYHNLNMRHYITVVFDEQKYVDWKYTNVTTSKKHPFADVAIPLNCDLKQYVVNANINDYEVNDLDPCEGYESIVPIVNDEVRKELGIRE